MTRGRVTALSAVAGILLVVAGAGVLAYERSLPALQEQSVEQGALSVTGLQRYAASHPAPPRPDQPRTGTWLLVPDLDIALPVTEGTGSDPVAYWAANHFPGTAAPGRPGNSYLYAHGLQGMFGSLLQARRGQEVHVRDYSSGTDVVLHIDRVAGRVGAHDLSWLHARSSVPQVTLQTCVDDNPEGDRFIVVAR